MNCGITLVSESVPDDVTAVIFADFLAERFFVVSILVSTRGLFRAEIEFINIFLLE